jgi:hypothetical protein
MRWDLRSGEEGGSGIRTSSETDGFNVVMGDGSEEELSLMEFP